VEPRSRWEQQLGGKQEEPLQVGLGVQVRARGRRVQEGAEELGWWGHLPTPRREGRVLREVRRAVTVQAAWPTCGVSDGEAG